MRTFIFVLASSIALLGCVTAPGLKGLNYTRVSQLQIPFGTPIRTPYILDSYDLNGDGADDFAISAKVRVPKYVNDFRKSGFVKSFIVQNDPTERNFKLFDLGKNGLTHRTWAGKFFRPEPGGATYFVLGRNNDFGSLQAKIGEKISIFWVSDGVSDPTISTVYVGRYLGSTDSVDVCDIDGDGEPEIYVNNGHAPLAGSQSRLKPEFIEFRKGRFVVGDVSAYILGFDHLGHYNNIVFDDVDDDGDCDFLGAVEVRKVGSSGNESMNSKTKSFAMLNKGEGIVHRPYYTSYFSQRIELPNPSFGSNNAAFGIGSGRLGGEVVVALTSSEYKRHRDNATFKKFAFQLFALRNGRFVDVTNDKLSGKMRNKEANQRFVRFFDIDGDGDGDIYLTLYDRDVEVYMNEENKFTLKRIPVRGANGEKAVVFLRSGRIGGCADMAVLDSNGELSLYECQ